eukprot:m.180913 g.180913  ORF g.180913 m.180913 type:complete len:133 (+) comp14953_c0_seq7:2493-2891(+)
MGGVWRWCRRGVIATGSVLLGIVSVGLLIALIANTSGISTATSPHHSPLSAAAYSNRSDSVRKLLDDGASPNDSKFILQPLNSDIRMSVGVLVRAQRRPHDMPSYFICGPTEKSRRMGVPVHSLLFELFAVP